MTFGDYLEQLRKRSNITLRTFAKMMDISPSYLSDIEKDRCLPPYRDKGSDFIEKAVSVLSLSNEESEQLYLLADRRLNENLTIAHDMAHYLLNAPEAQIALRKAVNKDIDSQTWDKIIELIEKKEVNE